MTLLRTTIAIAIVGALTISIYLGWAWNHSLKLGEQTYFVKPGMSLRTFARQLQADDVLPDSFSLVLLAYLKGQARKLKAGEYKFAQGISQRALLAQVIAGRVVEYPLALIEGWTFQQFLAAINAAPRMEKTLEGLAPDAIMVRLGYPGLHPEGQFYPDTYYYSAGTTDLDLLRRAFDRMQMRLRQEWATRKPELPIKNAYEALILASIVEKETGLASERSLIAGVFINRLRHGMRLQSDPTVIYGMGPDFDGNLRRRDLLRDSPYSTYTRAGLPPTPIAMPGSDALHAVLNPAATKALYFVSRNDGSHHFSET
ncbi:MAG: endolytic transglycosylase MltG, partial [Acidiferrobacterales bacterium]